MNREKKLLAALTIAIIAVVLIGETLVYSDITEYRANIEYDSDRADYSIYSNGASSFDLVISDNGNFEPTDRYLIYYDDTYCTAYDSSDMPVLGRMDGQEYYIDQLIKTLEYKGVTSITVVDAAALADALQNDVASANNKTALIVISGALPATVYTGQSTDCIFNWLDEGGRLYWLGNVIGLYYATPEELQLVPNCQTLFFGSDCVNQKEDGKAYEDVTANNYRYALSLSNNQTLYGLNGTALPDCLTLGYTDGQYSSVSIVKHGEGMICVLSGNYTDYQRADLSQIIASGLCYCSEIAYQTGGEVVRTTIQNTVQLPSDKDNYAGYIYIGGYFPSFGRTFYN